MNVACLNIRICIRGGGGGGIKKQRDVIDFWTQTATFFEQITANCIYAFTGST